MDIYFEAISFAAEAHKNQYRKGSKAPYIVHPLGVMEILIREKCNEEVVIAGVLHDVVEDTPYTLEDVSRKFGERIAYLVSMVSEPDKRDTWKNRKLHTLQLIRDTTDEDVLMLSCADKLHNVQSTIVDFEIKGDSFWSSFKAPKEEQMWYYQSLADIYLAKNPDKYLFRNLAKNVSLLFSK